jgi:hypothetical protein
MPYANVGVASVTEDIRFLLCGCGALLLRFGEGADGAGRLADVVAKKVRRGLCRWVTHGSVSGWGAVLINQCMNGAIAFLTQRQ